MLFVKEKVYGIGDISIKRVGMNSVAGDLIFSGFAGRDRMFVVFLRRDTETTASPNGSGKFEHFVADLYTGRVKRISTRPRSMEFRHDRGKLMENELIELVRMEELNPF